MNKADSKREKKLQKRHYQILIGLMIFGVVYHFFIAPTTIGYDSRYPNYILVLPIFIGILSLAVYRRRFLSDRFKSTKSVALWSFMCVFYLLQGLLFSYLSFGQIARVGWDLVQVTTAKNNISETLHCKPQEIWTTNRSSYISFTLDTESEKFHVSNQFAKEFEGKDLQGYIIDIEVRKGIWNYYLVDKWEMKENNTER